MKFCIEIELGYKFINTEDVFRIFQDHIIMQGSYELLITPSNKEDCENFPFKISLILD